MNIPWKVVCDLYKEFVIRDYCVLDTKYLQCHYSENKEFIVIRGSKISRGNCFGRRNSIVMVGYDATLKPILFETEIKKDFALALQIRNI